VVGRCFDQLRGAEALMPLLVAVRDNKRESSAQVSLRQVEADRQRVVHWKVCVRPLLRPSGTIEGLVISASDVTDEVTARQEIERANQRKDEFLAMLGHELRNPVAAIATAAEVMRLSGSSHPASDEVRDVVYRQVRHMSRLLDDLLDVSRITRGTIELRRSKLDLRDVAALAVQTAHQQMDARRQHLHVDLPEQPVWLLGDADRLAQVISNLLANASRYTPVGGTIEVGMRSHGDHVTVSVRDDGDGIAAEDLPFLFEPFTQSKRGLDRPGGGLGLGLTLVKKLIELHGGAVSVESAGPGRGSEFTLQIPTPQLDGDAPRSPALEPPTSSGRHILIVEDNSDFASSLADLLQGEGHRVETATDGARAIEALERSTPDVVLLDIGLPEMDGFELARRIRSLVHPAPLLVAVSGYGDEENLRRARESGIDHYLVKPLWREGLRQLLAVQ
jgi:signal transduction histidine kinase